MAQCHFLPHSIGQNKPRIKEQKSFHIVMEGPEKLHFKETWIQGIEYCSIFSKKNLPYPFILPRVRYHTLWVKEKFFLRKGKLTRLSSQKKGRQSFIMHPSFHRAVLEHGSVFLSTGQICVSVDKHYLLYFIF